MKRIISLLLVIVIMLSVLMIAPLSATAVECEVEVTSYVSGDYEYELLDDGTAIITEYTGSGDELKIPSTIDGYTVTIIGEGAFYANQTVVSVIVPDGVIQIDGFAFSWCSNLESVKLGKSVEVISDMAFYDCKKLVEINLPDSLNIIGVEAFAWCQSLLKIIIPESICVVDNGAFSNTAWYENQPDGVVCVNNVLYDYKGYMPKNTVIEVDEKITRINCSAFYDCGFENISEFVILNPECEIIEDIDSPYKVIPERIVIKGYINSKAQAYAQKNGNKFISLDEKPTEKPTDKPTPSAGTLGDTDGDGEVSVMDATAIQFHLAQIKTISDELLKNADADKDGKVSVMDATQIQMYLAQIIPEL